MICDCRCKHFTGVQHSACAIGVAYPMPIPCLTRADTSCEQRELITPEEIQTEADRTMRFMTQVREARAVIVRKEGKRRGVRGHVRCPIDGGRLVYSIASNGHIAAECNNLGCVRWME
jgi:hypothetical protein